MFLLFIYLVLFDSWDISFWESSSYLFLRKTSKRASCEFPTIFFFLFYFLGYIEDLLLSLKVQYINMWFFSVLWFWIHSKRTIWCDHLILTEWFFEYSWQHWIQIIILAAKNCSSIFVGYPFFVYFWFLFFFSWYKTFLFLGRNTGWNQIFSWNPDI